jgi:hypothetical protein
MDKERFDKAKKIIQRLAKNNNELSVHDYNLLDNFLGEVRRKLIDKPVETTKEEPKVIIEMDQEEGRKILHCLHRTSAKNSYGDLTGILDTSEKIEEQIHNQLL